MPSKKRTRAQLDQVNVKDRARRKTDPEWVARRYASCRAWHAREKAAGRKRVRTDYDYDHRLRTTCNFSVVEKEKLFETQASRCPICGTKDRPTRGWVVDHDHSTGVVRGVLCWQCNNGLGFFRDNPIALRLAALYLEKHQ